MLENREGLKIGMIVNDVASINVDAKLVRTTNTDEGELPPDTVQLENGKSQHACNNLCLSSTLPCLPKL
jgi:G3E family GTPase